MHRHHCLSRESELFIATGGEMIFSRLKKIIHKRELNALFQPIVQMQSGEIIGYEGLIRGPSDSPLHSPLALFKAARMFGLVVEIEHLCRSVVIERFAELSLPGKLFLNISPDCLYQAGARYGETLSYLKKHGVNPNRVIIELTENQPTFDYDLMREAVRHYRDMGFQIAIDDLGEGFASLRLWSELRPDYVKIDRHFIQAINQDPIKLQFVRSIQEIAENTGSCVIAEGIETHSELLLVRELGISMGQGYYIARPSPEPPVMIPAEVAKTLGSDRVAIYPHEKGITSPPQTLVRLLREVMPASPNMSNNQVLDIFVKNPEISAIPVVENGAPLGLITRTGIIDRFARLYQRELYGAKPCTTLMDDAALIVDKNITMQELSQIIADGDSRHLSNGFIVVDNGRYVGTGTGHDLMREITQMQIKAAKYANPLTLLPGSVPINEHVDRLLVNKLRFCLCYFDIDHFKPFNDVYGYRKGDEILQLTGQILASCSDPEIDMVGHIGGDDFIIVFQSEDWENRCNEIMSAFSSAIVECYTSGDVQRGGYESEDRRGTKLFHPLASLSIGGVKVDPERYWTTHHVADAASDAKKQAKKIPGNSLFIERRKP
ncbi:MAG: GGDEF domain-containing protein [Oxalobacter sp.]|nr:MAG: GGDEF domain-containing protein [Oxalobacter sp.]